MPTSREARLLFIIAAAVLIAAPSSRAAWNLPYPQRAVYDYSKYYSTSLNAFIAGSPDLFKTELAKGWRFYKANFIMSNGLVNHQRLENNSVVGKAEAVSEGQGYGMLLAVLNSDQVTFNRIFEAANQYMWRADKQSYFIWNWPSNGQGAATDADLDIGLALVFADELQKKGLWQAYSKNGLTYRTRALEIIKSIRQHMTSSDYLLPGDNWGGDAINNLNPSYFATAWMKVFNAYQKEVDFTTVITKCYAVLAKMPRYNSGQAADWVNTNGGQASQAGGKIYRGLGMASDGIRTPWRFAMDAMWFDDARAVAFCAKSKATLTEYTNVTNPNFLLAQMAHYTDGGQAVAETKGSFDNVAMWSCAILGSKDQAYTTKGLSGQLIGKILGTSSDFLGASSLQDDKFYYKQSIGLLGFAAITGQFPNIWADMQPSSVHTSSSLSLMGKTAVSLANNRTLSVHVPYASGSSRLELHTLAGKRLFSTNLVLQRGTASVQLPSGCANPGFIWSILDQNGTRSGVLQW